jgi:dienelactone hydrolase
MHTQTTIYHHENQALHGFLANDPKITTPKPAVLVAHDWSGRSSFALEKAQMLARLGYVGFALDMYGEAKIGSTLEERMALISPLMNDRKLLQNRMQVALNLVKSMPEVDANRIAVIGFCFGGLCALDLARTGADIKAVVSFHGLLNKPNNLEKKSIQAKVLVLHGYDDPMVTPENVNEFCQEMTEAGADWQVHMYGHTKHAFTNPNAHDTQLGTIYDAKAEQRALQAMQNFLAEVFE